MPEIICILSKRLLIHDNSISLQINLPCEEVEAVTSIPRDDIIRGSVLDLNHKTGEMSRQSLAIIRKGSLPLEKMKHNLKMFQAFTKSGKSSGYGKEQPRTRMFQPHLNKTKPRPRKNNLFRVETSSSEPDLSGDFSEHPDLDLESAKTRSPGDRRMRWSLGEMISGLSTALNIYCDLFQSPHPHQRRAAASST